MADDLAVEIDIGFADDTDLIELRGGVHGDFPCAGWLDALSNR